MSKNFLFTDLTAIKNISGGSGAETWVVKDKKSSLFVRKFAREDAGRKLIAQSRWLNDFKSRVFCPEVLNAGDLHGYYFYDMTYLKTAQTGFDKLVSDNSEQTITDIISALVEFDIVFKHQTSQKNHTNREKYLAEKLFKNIELAKERDPAFAALASADELQINGEGYLGLSRLLETTAIKNLITSIVSEDLYRAGHGDLTLSNILVQDAQVAFIDPNPNFEFISLEQEYSKVLQSTVVKYELFSELSCEIRNNTEVSYSYVGANDFSSCNEAILASPVFNNLRLENLFFHLAIHLARILPYIKPENKIKSYVYFSEIIKLLNSVATAHYRLN